MSAANTVLDFSDLEEIRLPVKIGKGDYTLVEASADTSVKYRNAIVACTKMVDGKPAGLVNLADTEVFLVANCLLDNETGKPVDPKFVRGLKNRVFKPIFEKISEISELEDAQNDKEGLEKQLKETQDKLDKLNQTEETRKNASSGTETNSESPKSSV